MNKLGRPKSKKSKENRLEIRLTEEELLRLEAACKKFGKSKSEIARTGILGQCIYAEKFL